MNQNYRQKSPFALQTHFWKTDLIDGNEKPIPKHIAIAGNIGAGKTSLPLCWVKHFHLGSPLWGYRRQSLFVWFLWWYDSMVLQPQIYFLNNRYRQILDIQMEIIQSFQDRTIFEDAHILPQTFMRWALMSKKDFDNYFGLFSTMSSQVKCTLIFWSIWASVPTLVDHIQTRGRDYEGEIWVLTIWKLNQRYEKWIETTTTDHYWSSPTGLNFIQNKEDLGTMLK